MKILRFTQSTKPGSMLGFLDLEVTAWGDFTIYGIKLFTKNGHRWIQFPTHSKDEPSGEKKYFPHCAFKDLDMKKKFEEKLLKVLDQYLLQNPEKTNSNQEFEF